MGAGTSGPSHNIVCISTIDWDFLWQGHQEIMSTLARQGHRVLFIENTGVRSARLKDLTRLKHRLLNWQKGVRGIRKVGENLYAYAPLVLPFPYSRLARLFNTAIMRWTLSSWTRTMRFENPIVWTWLPTGLTLELIRALDAQLVIYYCCDNFEASSRGSRRIRETENVLLRKADLVFAHSKALFDRCSRFTDQVHVFQYGFNREVFAQAGEQMPVDLATIKPPILGYVGGIHQQIDLDLLEQVALRHPDKSLVLVGPLQVNVDRFARFSNVHFLGQKSHADLPAYIRHFDVGLIPYALNEYTRSVYPTKLNEYLVLGKPVVSTKLPEVEYFNETHEEVVSVGDSHDAFINRIGEELCRDNESLRAQRIRVVQKHAWVAKIEAMTRLIQDKLDEKVESRERNWQRALRRAYRTSRRKVAVASAIGAIGYALIFHTPLLWAVAEPLRVVDEPAKADVIVVLAAGIGESGVAGEGYQEKVMQGAALFKQGYADHLILSSGVTYVFKEAQVMKALAIDIGVPQEAIILEERGGGNYASLLNTKQIMQERGWTQMLVVTSPYNAARSRLVTRRNLPNTTVRFTSGPSSAFFGNREKVEARHVRAIAHEYLAILYYRLKGYV